MCVCVCVCERERESETERVGQSSIVKREEKECDEEFDWSPYFKTSEEIYRRFAFTLIM